MRVPVYRCFMALKPTVRVRPGKPLSFRFKEDTVVRLRALVDLLDMSQAKILEALINTEFEEQKRRSPKKIAAATAAVRKSAK